MVDTDITAMRVSFDDRELLEPGKRYMEFQRERGNNVAIGPRLGPLILGAGLELMEHDAAYQKVPAQLFALGGPIVAAEHEMLTAGAISADDARRFAEARTRAATLPGAALFGPQYIAVGRSAT